MRKGRLGCMLVGKARGGVRDLKVAPVHTLGRRHAANLPVVLGHKGHALALALDHQGERGRLHAAGGAHVAKAAKAREREVAREDSAPDEVDVLAALAGVGQVLIEFHEVLEGRRHLALDEGGVARAVRGEVGRHLAHHVERVRADELALAVEVRGDDDRVGLLGEVLEDADDLLFGRLLEHGCPGEVGQALDLPAFERDAVGEEGLALALVGRTRKAIGDVGGKHLAVLGEAVPALLLIEKHVVGKVGRQDVPGEPHGDPLLPVHLKPVDLRVVDLVVFGFGGGEQLRDLLRGDVLLCNDELHGGTPWPVRTGTDARWAGPRGGRAAGGASLRDSISDLARSTKCTDLPGGALAGEGGPSWMG